MALPIQSKAVLYVQCANCKGAYVRIWPTSFRLADEHPRSCRCFFISPRCPQLQVISFAHENKACDRKARRSSIAKMPEKNAQQRGGRGPEYAGSIGAKCDLTAKIRGLNSAVAKDSEAPA